MAGKPLLVQNFVEIALSHTISEINAFYVFVFYREIQNDHQNGGKMIFGQKCQTILQIPYTQTFRQNRSISHRF